MKNINKSKVMMLQSVSRRTIQLFIAVLTFGCVSDPSPKSVPLVAKHYNSGFESACYTYNSISAASDGKIYYVLSSKSIDIGGRVYVYDPKSDKVKFLADLTEVCGEKDLKTVPQGKGHVDFYEYKGKLYYATHQAYYEVINGEERIPIHLPEGYKPYPGGHIISYDLNSGEFKNLAIAPEKEGIQTMTMDTERGQIYAITWPSAYFIHYDIDKNELKNLGRTLEKGEVGTPGQDYRVLCRSILVDQNDGSAYYSTAEGDIFRYFSGAIKKVEGVSLKIDYFGKYDYTQPGTMSYNWRSILWYAPEGVAYGVHGSSGYLFRFDPRKPKIEIVDRITSEPSKKSGMFDKYYFGYLGFKLGPDKHTIYYLTGGPINSDGQSAKRAEGIPYGLTGLENMHLITYNIPNRKYVDHGPIFYEDGSRPTWVNSIAFGKDGYVYTLAQIDLNEKEDLVKIPDPLTK